MADISTSTLQSINRVTTLVEKNYFELNRQQCRCLARCLEQVKVCLFSQPISICTQLLERIQRTVEKVEIFVVKCSNKDWLVNTLSVGVSEEETKGFILELRWCLGSKYAKVQENCQIQWTPPQLVLPSAADICQDRQSLVIKLDKFLATKGVDCEKRWIHRSLSGTCVDSEKRSLAIYLQGRLKILEGDGKCKPSLEHLLWKMKLPEPSKYEQLGRGSSALVYKTSWLGVPSAVKSLRCCGDTFLKEAGTLAMLNHPNIVKLYCCYEDRKSQSLVMELMDGSLFDLLRERRESRNGSSPFELEEAVEILLQIVKGMLYLHEKGFAHRDLKCLNILVTKTKCPQARSGDLIVKVADFELVKLFDPTASNFMTLTHKKIGSHVWRAPELLNNNAKIKPRRADIYSFGMVCFEVLTGELPFEHCGFTTKELHKKIIHDGLRPMLPKHCPEQLRTLIEDCWNAACELRPSFEEIHDRLLKLRAFLMMGTGAVITRDVQISEEFAITRATTSFIKMCKFLLSICMSNKEENIQTNHALRQSLERLPENHAKAPNELSEAVGQAPNAVLRGEDKLGSQGLKASCTAPKCHLSNFRGHSRSRPNWPHENLTPFSDSCSEWDPFPGGSLRLPK